MAITFSGVLTCIRRFLRIIMVVLNVIGGLCGLAILVAGAWALVGEGTLVVISPADSEKFTGVPVLMVVLGVFIMILSGLGVVGSIFNKTKWGRVVLIVYAITLAILVLMEIIGGVVAAVRKDDVAALFETSAEATFKEYATKLSNKDVWDNFQRSVECCGVHNYTEFRTLLNISVPESCCNTELIVAPKTCANYSSPLNPGVLWNVGCVDATKNTLANYLAGVAAIAIIFALIQIVIVVVSIFVAAEKNTVKYDTMSSGADKHNLQDDAAESS
eukprot:Em0017g575a